MTCNISLSVNRSTENIYAMHACNTDIFSTRVRFVTPQSLRRRWTIRGTVDLRYNERSNSTISSAVQFASRKPGNHLSLTRFKINKHAYRVFERNRGWRVKNWVV